MVFNGFTEQRGNAKCLMLSVMQGLGGVEDRNLQVLLGDNGAYYSSRYNRRIKSRSLAEA